jgi:hypothetical protein
VQLDVSHETLRTEFRQIGVQLRPRGRRPRS